jgi:hypothetical protein
VLFLPPFRDPFNYHYEPLVISSLDEVGATLQSRLLSENKGGATTRSGAHYDTWYNGNLHLHLLPQRGGHPRGNHRQPGARNDPLRARATGARQ